MMQEEIAIPDDSLKYILFQRTAYLRLPKTLIYRILNRILPFSIYNPIVRLEAILNSSTIKSSYEDDMRKEYLSIKDYLPETCSSILDIGCGVAGIDIFIGDHYKHKQPDFFLLDKTHTEESVWYELKTKGAFYNSLEIAEEMLIRNGISKTHVHLIEATDNYDINIDNRLDIVISLISWGFHYPVETYIEKVYGLMKSGGILILDVRKGINGMSSINKVFQEVKVILEQEKYTRILATKL